MNFSPTLAIALTLSLVAVGIVSTMPGEAQLQPQDCQDAAKWHLEQALKWTVRHEQEYHLNAADAADTLSTKGYTCADWRKDRMEPFSQEGQEANQ